MIFSLIFLFCLSIIVTFGSFLILKSDLEFSERFFSMFCILLLFSSISILNEYKQPIDLIEVINNVPNNSNITTVLWEIIHEEDIKALEKRFYYPYQNKLRNHYKLPIIRDCKPFLNEILDISHEKLKDNFGFFYWVDSDRDIGVSFALREFSRILQGEMSNIPILYINLKQLHEFFWNDLHLAMKLSNIEVLEKVLENFNKKNLIPVLIIDAIEKSFSQEINISNSCLEMSELKEIIKCLKSYQDEGNIKNMGKSYIFEKLLALFQKYEMKIIVVNYELNKEINDFPHFIERKRVKNRHRDWENYILTILNEFIGKKEKRLNIDDIQQWRRNMEIDFRVIANYYQNLKEFKSPDGNN